MREKSTTSKRPQDVATRMNNFVSVFHASSLDTQQQAQAPSQLAASNSYCYIPGQYWQTLDYYDMAMDICTDYSDPSQMPSSVMLNDISPSTADDMTPLGSPLDFAPDIFGSLGDSLRLTQTDSSLQGSPSAETECPNNGRCASQQLPCEICRRDKRERRKEQNRKAQRNHRLRSEAKLELLRAKVKTQADEIVMLRDFNQSLMKHIETIESKAKDEGPRDAGGQGADATLQDTSGSP